MRPAPCPFCGQRAKRTHSWYERALADLPWGKHAVDAVQVADRFHRLQNLAEALELAFTGYARELQGAEQARRQDAVAEGGPVRPDPPPPPKRPLPMAAARREQRMATHRQVWDLYRQGWPGERIARHLGIGRPEHPGRRCLAALYHDALGYHPSSGHPSQSSRRKALADLASGRVQAKKKPATSMRRGLVKFELASSLPSGVALDAINM